MQLVIGKKIKKDGAAMSEFLRDVVAIALGVAIGGVILIIGCEYFEIYKFVAPPN